MSEEKFLTNPTNEEIAELIRKLPASYRILLVIVTPEGAVNLQAEQFASFEIFGLLEYFKQEVIKHTSSIRLPDTPSGLPGESKPN